MSMGYLLFFIGLAALIALCWRTHVLLRLRGADGIGAGLVTAFAALTVSATVPSAFGALTGATWTAALLLIATGVLRLRRSVPASASAPAFGFERRHWLLLLVPVVLVAYAQLITPVAKVDDLMYHGSRAGYWLGHQSVLPFPSHNERQTVFPYAGDLFFAFGVFTARSELLGRLFVFLAYPITLGLIAGMLRRRAVPPALAIGAAWVVGVTPLVRDAAIGIKPDLWGLVFALIAVNAAWSYMEAGSSAAERGKQAVTLLGALCAAVAVKFTFLLLTPLAAMLLWRPAPARQRLLWFCTVPCWLLAFGVAITLVHNRVHEGGWLGSPAMSATHRPDSLADAVPRHLTRLPFVIFGVPAIPSESLRDATERTLRALADRMGATAPLPQESPEEPWPGMFLPVVTRINYGFSFLGLFPLLGLVAAVVNWRRVLPTSDGGLALLPVGLGVVMTAGVACMVRWQPASTVPERFIVPGVVLTLVGVAWLWHLTNGRRRSVVALVVALAAFHTFPFANQTRHSIIFSQTERASRAHERSAFGAAAKVVPPGSRVLLLAGQGGDYLLFHPQLGFPTRVFTWGRKPFTADVFTAALEETRPDAIVFEAATRLSFHWHPDLPVGPFVEFLERQTSFELELEAQPTVVFVRREPLEKKLQAVPHPGVGNPPRTAN